MRWKVQIGLGALAAVALLQAGCLVVGPEKQKQGCENYSYEKCETYCDPESCWQECWEEEGTAEKCPSDSGSPGGACEKDGDCPEGLVCLSGTCGGHGGICQSCEDSFDCAGSSARCVALGGSGDNTKICSPTCQAHRDCPSGFQCVKMGDAETGQCLPERGSDGGRSCDDVPDLECTSAADCKAGERCVQNECVPPDDAECSSDSDCASGEECRDLECVPSGQPECVSRSDCRSSEICVNWSCEPQNPDGCVFNEECDEGALCVDGQCLSRCEDRSDCNNREFCRKTSDSEKGLCQPIECRTNPDCPSGQICVNASCVDACTRDSNCDAGYICTDNGFCKPDPDVECRSNAECTRDEMCHQGECVSPCDCNQQCPEGEVCNMENGLCEDPESPDPPECEDDCDCPSGQSCNSDGSCG